MPVRGGVPFHVHRAITSEPSISTATEAVWNGDDAPAAQMSSALLAGAGPWAAG